MRGITDEYEGGHYGLEFVQVKTFNGDSAPTTSMDDVIAVKDSVTICLIELRDTKEQAAVLLNSLKTWFAKSGKQVCGYQVKRAWT